MSKAAVRKNQADLLNQQKKDRKDLFAQRRQLASGTGSINFGSLATNSGGGSGGGLLNVNIENPSNTNALIKTGDTMDGPLAFKPNSITISGGKLTMSTILLSTPTSWCIATGESSAADDLYYIITQNNGTDVGALFSGQLLILQAGVYNITLKHRGTSSSNIYIPSGSDLTLTGYTSGTSTGGEIAILMYDDQVVGGEWILVATSKPLGSGGGGVTNPVNVMLSLGGNQLQRVTALFLDGSGNNDHSIDGQTTGISYGVDAISDYHTFKVNSVEKFRVADSWIFLPSGVDMLIENENTIRPNNTTDRIGFHSRFWNDATRDAIGSQGTVEVPYSALTSWPTEANLNSYFGESSGSCGAVKNSTGSSGYKGRFYFKIGDGTADEGWYYVTAVEV